MRKKLHPRLASEQGFTLIELLIVIVILGILVAVAVPAYLSFRGNAQDAAAKSNVRSAIPAAEDFYQATVDPISAAAKAVGYTGMTGAELRALVPGVSPNVKAGANASGGYCIQDSEDGNAHYATYTGGTGGSSVITYGTSACAVAYSAS